MGAEWFPARLRELREAAGLTQHDLAKKIGVHVDAVARWEQGRREPSWTTVLALAGALGVDCTAFTTPPTEGAEPRGRGRPRKVEGDQAGTEQPIQQKGRKRKKK
jgi:transcriptional regulator with XRE-family HTH domain